MLLVTIVIFFLEKKNLIKYRFCLLNLSRHVPVLIVLYGNESWILTGQEHMQLRWIHKICEGLQQSRQNKKLRSKERTGYFLTEWKKK
jgi:hypothetical protein